MIYLGKLNFKMWSDFDSQTNFVINNAWRLISLQDKEISHHHMGVFIMPIGEIKLLNFLIHVSKKQAQLLVFYLLQNIQNFMEKLYHPKMSYI